MIQTVAKIIIKIQIKFFLVVDFIIFPLFYKYTLTHLNDFHNVWEIYTWRYAIYRDMNKFSSLKALICHKSEQVAQYKQ